MSKKIKIAIIGGGIAGVVLMARLVRCPQLEVNLYEASALFSQVGAGISFGTNAVHAMQILGLEEAYDRVADCPYTPVSDIWYQWRNGYNNEYLGTSSSAYMGQSSVHRADFLEQLMPYIPVGQVHFNKRLTQLDDQDEEIRLHFSDETSVTCDYVIGCDGIHSMVRRHVLSSHGLEAIQPEFSGIWAYRGIIDQASYQTALRDLGLDETLAQAPQAYLAEHKHVHAFPIRQGQAINILAFQSKPLNPHVDANANWITPVCANEMLEQFSDLSLSCRTLLSQLEQPTIWALHDLPPLATYIDSKQRVIVIGDAAHAMLPHQGSGAGQCIEDAVILAHLLSQIEQVHQLEDVSKIYDTIRRPRATQAQKTSRETAKIYQAQHPDYQDFQQIAQHLSTWFDWLWQHDLVEDLCHADDLIQQTLQPN